MKTHFFTLIDEQGKTAGIVAATNDREFESMVMDCTREHFSVDDVSLETSLQMEWFKNHVKPQSITIACNIGDDTVIHYDVRIEHTVVYREEPKPERIQNPKSFKESEQVYQVLNDGLSPASTESNPDAICIGVDGAEQYIAYLKNEGGCEDMNFTYQKLN